MEKNIKIAISHPGKIGDILHALPTVRHISKIFDTKVDFWTSSYCQSLIPLLKYQSYINDAFVAQNFKIEHDQCGIQPWNLLPEQEYDRIFMLGFREYPKGRLVDYFADLHGLTMVDKTIKYDFVPKEKVRPSVVICPGRNPYLKPIFGELIDKLSETYYEVVQIGPKTELIGGKNTTNVSTNMLDELSYLANCDYFVGTLSANLVLANGFGCKKIVLCEKERHNPAHDIHSDFHHYLPSDSSLDEIMKCVT